MLTVEELARRINLVKDAVDRSVIGPLFVYPDQDVTNKQMNTIAFQTFSALITQIIAPEIDFEPDS
ncbi:MAG TPA: hypothetical protein PLC67_11970 [Spirochaetota bacterium]|jgi:hypothetical protein|nr:hypothetical protein [Spirochaetota bacterium]